MSILDRIEKELKQIEDSKLTVTMGVRFTKPELEELEELATANKTSKAGIIRAALKALSQESQQGQQGQEAKPENNFDEIDF